MIYESCFGSGITKDHVLKARWGAINVVLETERPFLPNEIRLHIRNVGHKMYVNRTEFIKQAEQSLYHNILGKHHNLNMQNLDQLVSECDLKVMEF